MSVTLVPILILIRFWKKNVQCLSNKYKTLKAFSFNQVKFEFLDIKTWKFNLTQLAYTYTSIIILKKSKIYLKKIIIKCEIQISDNVQVRELRW